MAASFDIPQEKRLWVHSVTQAHTHTWACQFFLAKHSVQTHMYSLKLCCIFLEMCPLSESVVVSSVKFTYRNYELYKLRMCKHSTRVVSVPVGQVRQSIIWSVFMRRRRKAWNRTVFTWTTSSASLCRHIAAESHTHVPTGTSTSSR